MLVEVDEDELHFQTIARTGRTIDSGDAEAAGKAQARAGANQRRKP